MENDLKPFKQELYGPLEAAIQDGRPKEAAVLLEEMVRSGLDKWESYVWMGRIHGARGAWREAKRYLRMAVALRPPAMASPWMEMARVLKREGRIQAARRLMERLVRLQDTPETRLELGRTYDAMGLRRKALRELLRVLPDSARLPSRERIWMEKNIRRIRRYLRDMRKRRSLRHFTRKRRVLHFPTQVPAGWDRMLAVIPTTRCNQRCLFCFERSSHFTRPDLPLEYFAKAVALGRRRGFTAINLLGGEVTLCKWLVPGIALARESGLQVKITSNGTRLSSKHFLQSLVEAGLNGLDVSLPSHVPEDDFRLTGLRNGLKLRCQAMRNISDLRRSGARHFCFGVVIVLNSMNARYLSRMAQFVQEYSPDLVYFIAMRITQNIEDVALIPSYASLREELIGAMRELEKAGIACKFEGVPLCFIPPDLHHNHKINVGRGVVGFDYKGRMKNMVQSLYHECYVSARCAKCTIRRYCCQLQKEYVGIHGDGEIRPFSMPPAELYAKFGAKLHE